MSSQDTGRNIIILGLFLVVVGAVVYFKNRVQWLGLLGRLPGDFRYESENVKFYFPLATSLLVSGIISLVLWLFRKAGS